MNPYVELMRPANAGIAAFSTLLGALVVVGADLWDASRLAPVGIGMAVAFIVTAGGNALNDHLDAAVDRKAHPRRPVPSRRLAHGRALWFAFACFIVAQPLTLLVVYIGLSGVFPLVVELLALNSLVTYELYLKARGLIGNLMVSFLSALTLLFGASCAAGPLHEGMPTVGALFLLAFFASAGREVTKDIEDVESDRGTRETLPMQVGAPLAGGVAALFVGIAVAMSPTPYWPLATMGWSYLGVVLVADMAFIYSLVILRSSPGGAQRAQKAGMVLALLAFLAGSVEGGFA